MTTIIDTSFISLVLRGAVGIALLAHGLPKVRGGWRQSGQWVASMGIPPVAATLVTILEFLGGIFLIAGFLVPLVAAFLAVQFLSIIAMKITKMKAGFMAASGKPAYEIDFIYFILSLALLFLGPGAFSVDAMIGL